jgi:hypothetical protein
VRARPNKRMNLTKRGLLLVGWPALARQRRAVFIEARRRLCAVLCGRFGRDAGLGQSCVFRPKWSVTLMKIEPVAMTCSFLRSVTRTSREPIVE